MLKFGSYSPSASMSCSFHLYPADVSIGIPCIPCPPTSTCPPCGKFSEGVWGGPAEETERESMLLASLSDPSDFRLRVMLPLILSSGQRRASELYRGMWSRWNFPASHCCRCGVKRVSTTPFQICKQRRSKSHLFGRVPVCRRGSELVIRVIPREARKSFHLFGSLVIALKLYDFRQ